MNKVAIYVRVSTKGQAAEGYSIDEQIALLTNYCKLHKWSVYDTYIDAGVSGATVIRPELSRLSKDAKKKKFNTMIVYDLKRLGRSQRNNIAFIEDVLEKNGIGFISLTENFDTSSALGKAMVGILSAFGQLDRDTIRERMMMGKIGRAKSGKPMMWGQVSYGYRYDKETSSLVIDEAEAAIVKIIFSEFLGGRSVSKLRDYLNENNLITDGKKWYYEKLRRILTNPVYAGKVRYIGEIYDGANEKIIDYETFLKVQEEYDRRRQETYAFTKNSRPFRSKYLLSGIIRCGYCSAPLEIILNKKRLDGTRTRKYQCSNRHVRSTRPITVYNDYKKCDSGSYLAEPLEEYVISQIKKLQMNPNELDSLFVSSRTIDISKIEKQIAEISAKIKKLNELYLNDMIELDELKEQNSSLMKKRDLLEEQLNNNPEIEHQKKKNNFSQVLCNKDILSLEYDKQKNVVNLLIDRVFVKKGHIKIKWKI